MSAPQPDYPITRRDDLVEVLHGQPIADPYRWLEDPDSAETGDWVDAQNLVTEQHLASLPGREWFTATMGAILARPRAGVPFSKAGKYLVSRNDGSQDQDLWYVADSLEELLAGGRVLLDPNPWSDQGTDSLAFLSVSGDASVTAYGVSEGGSDWRSFHLIDTATGETISDAAIQTKFSDVLWLPDHQSYLYTDFAHDGHAGGTQTDAVGGGRLRLHRLGTPQSADDLVLEFIDDGRLLTWSELSNDRRWVFTSIVRGTESRNRLWAFPVVEVDGRSTLGEPVTVVDEAVAEFQLVRMIGRTAVLFTDLDAPRGRVVTVDLDDPELLIKSLIDEGESTLEHVAAAGEMIFTVALFDARPELRRWTLDGVDLGPIMLDGGALVGFNGEPDDHEVFVGMASVGAPTTAYRIDAGTGEITALDKLIMGGTGAFTAPKLITERRRVISKDGTPVPYFLISKADLGLDLDTGLDRASEPRPTMLCGYGGFKVPVLADYRPGWLGWLMAGGVLAVANLRGGGEFGTQWYEDGRLAKKQNVFDDFIAVGEHLTHSGVTTPAQLVLQGRSNGGLLVGATLTQRPDLAAVALPGVGVLDMLRFHKFTIGAAWISDYGDPDDAEQFADALAYSPLHNVKPGVRYPATLITTGDHDDRVVPLHSHKFAAALQHAQAGSAPVLTRIEIATGHGAGKPTSMVAAEWADQLSFAAQHTGLRTPPGSGE